MKILYVGDFKDYWSTENYITYALRQNGCTVLCAQEDNIRVGHAVLGAAQKHNVDFVLFSKGLFQGADDALRLLRGQGILSVGWIFDLYFEVPRVFGRKRARGAGFLADICFVTDGGHAEDWKLNKVNNVLLRQGVHEPDAYIAKSIKHPPIVFIGTRSYDERIAMLQFLEKTYGSDFVAYGVGQKRLSVRGPELNVIMASAKIVVGDSMPAPYYWSNRIYEVTGRGGFLIHPRVKGLETEFIDGEHYVGYDFGNMEQLKEKIDFYLIHNRERETIRLAGHAHTKKNYTYTKRCKQLLDYVRDYKRQE